FDLFDYFDCIAGASMDLSRCKKEDVIAYAFEKGGVSNLQNAVMVGDREQDVTGAKKTGIDSIGVLYGYGSREELETAGATHIAPAVMDVQRIIAG
ncbi:MAG: HAD hydrolase-like protein, partial [Spirochaetaceae bacterium]|nr:HAD hydrolase-like protein [Spirochaetaceae bacterium]